MSILVDMDIGICSHRKKEINRQRVFMFENIKIQEKSFKPIRMFGLHQIRTLLLGKQFSMKAVPMVIWL